MSIGAIGYAGFGVDSNNSTTTTYSSTIIEFIPFISETLQVFRDDIVDPGITQSWDEDGMFDGFQRIEGNMTAIPNATNLGYFLRSAFDTSTFYPSSGGPVNENSCATFREHRFITKATQFQTGSGADVPTLTCEIHRGPAGVGSAFVYYNLATNNLEMSINGGDNLRVSADYIGRSYGRKAITAVVTYRQTQSIPWHSASVAFGNTAAGLAGSPQFENLTFRIENNLQGIPRLDGRKTADLVKRTDFRRIAVNGTIAFINDSEYDRFTNGSEMAIRVCFRDPTNSSSWLLMLDLPRIRYLTFPVNIGGPGRVTVGFTGKALFDANSNYSLQVMLINSKSAGYNINSAG